MNILKNGGDTRGMIESQNKCLNKLKIRTKLVIIRVQNRNIFQITEVSLHKFFFACLLSTNLLRSFCSPIIKSSTHQLINSTMNSHSHTTIIKVDKCIANGPSKHFLSLLLFGLFLLLDLGVALWCGGKGGSVTYDLLFLDLELKESTEGIVASLSDPDSSVVSS